MPASLGQRCLMLLAQAGLPLIALIVYLDGGLDSQPIFMFVLLTLGDIFNAFCICYNIWTCPEFRRFESYAETWDFFFNVRQVYTYQMICMLLKILFQVFLFIHLSLHIHVPAWIIMAPLWGILTIILYDLTHRLYKIQS